MKDSDVILWFDIAKMRYLSWESFLAWNKDLATRRRLK